MHQYSAIQSVERTVSEAREPKMLDDNFKEIAHEMVQEQAEAAMRDCIKHWHKEHLPTSMELKGIYDSLLTVGFDENQAIMLTISQIK